MDTSNLVKNRVTVYKHFVLRDYSIELFGGEFTSIGERVKKQKLKRRHQIEIRRYRFFKDGEALETATEFRHNRTVALK